MIHQRSLRHGHYALKSKVMSWEVQFMRAKKARRISRTWGSKAAPGVHSRINEAGWSKYVPRRVPTKLIALGSFMPLWSPKYENGWQLKPAAIVVIPVWPNSWIFLKQASSVISMRSTSPIRSCSRCPTANGFLSTWQMVRNPHCEAPIPIPPIPAHNSIRVWREGGGPDNSTNKLWGSTCRTEESEGSTTKSWPTNVSPPGETFTDGNCNATCSAQKLT